MLVIQKFSILLSSSGEQHHRFAFVNKVQGIYYHLSFAAELVSVYDAIHFGEKTNTEFFILPNCNRLRQKY